MNKSKGGRPQMEEGKRSFKIDVRFNAEEYRRIGEMEKESGLKKAELVRRRLLGDDAAVLINAKELLKTLDGISLELARAGNNINQLARYANRLNKHHVLSAAVAERFLEEMDKYRALQLELQSLFRKLLRAM
jgi:hypothetical protein